MSRHALPYGEIAIGDAVEWAKAYDGEPFHALLCDPPYELGFMGKRWDKSGIAFRPETWDAFKRTMHPGAFGMAFASTRGYHRMACAIEDAGFTIHPMVMWVFGCLSDDTEILTDTGWERYTPSLLGRSVACYNVDSGGIEWNPVQDVVAYPYDETAYSIKSEHTDQLVSRNHRCIVDRDGRWAFEYAERLRETEVVPVLAQVPELPRVVPGGDVEAGAEAASLFASVHQCDGGEQERRPRNAHRGSGVDADNLPDVRGRNLEAERVGAEVRDGRLLLAELPREGERGASGVIRCQREGQAESIEGAARLTQRGLEGRRDLLQDARELCRGKVRPVPAGMADDGPQGWVRDGASTVGGASHRPAATAFRGGTPRQPRSYRQPSSQPGTVRVEHSAQAVRASRLTAPSVASVTPIHYTGTVWCVRVPTGAFVARRNGRIFVTGNSGFPKATRVNTGEWTETGETESLTDIRSGSMHAGRDTSKVYERAKREPAGAAAAFQGHRYGLQAMKPALEPICVFQKPYKGRPVDCIVETGAGALNIDGARVGTDGGCAGAGAGMASEWGNLNGTFAKPVPGLGRWPANLALDECGAAALDAMSGVSRSTGGIDTTNPNGSMFGAGGGVGRNAGGLGDTGGASRFFYTAKADRSERDMGLDAAPWRTRNRVKSSGMERDPKWAPVQAKNDHPTVKPVDLARWLATLLLPPGSYAPRRLLNPFCGSGTEFIGAVMAGWEHIQSIELSPEYAELARHRVMAAQPPLPMEVSL